MIDWSRTSLMVSCVSKRGFFLPEGRETSVLGTLTLPSQSPALKFEIAKPLLSRRARKKPVWCKATFVSPLA